MHRFDSYGCIFSEARVRAFGLHFRDIHAEPADSHLTFDPIKLGDKGLNIDQGRTVHHIHIRDVEMIVLDPCKGDDG